MEYKLTKPEDPLFSKKSTGVKWIKYDEIGRYKETCDNIEIGCSLLMSPFNMGYTWLTTIVTDIIENNENYIVFKTNNSVYRLDRVD